ncbi:MAG: Trimethylamine methyltransferase family protein [Olavius algarvensis Delta 4 endosymbiont]|nr:MAG: Trimethylamine methyltransferase family protein [Olavius algarvensis Delta 4 endosymbiont]
MLTGGLTGGLYKPLTDQEIETIHQKALDVLEQVGIGYEDDLEALDVLARAGCEIDRHTGRIYMPRDIVAETVAKAPREFTLYSRDGKNDLQLGQDRVYAGTGGTTVQILDLDTGKIRGTCLADQYHIAKLVDTLDNIHFYQSAVAPLDIPTARYDPNILFAAMMGTRKHIMFGCNFRQGLVEAFNMAALVVGNDEILRKKPVFSISACAIISPLKFCSQSVANVRQAATLGIPTTITTAPMSGSTAPMTMAGTLLQAHAEELAGLTVHQLTVPGAPVLYGALPARADMKTLVYRGGAIECGTMQAAQHQLSQHIGIPNYASSGLSDSKIPDAQAGWEKAFTTLLAVMGGNNYIHHAAGMLESMNAVALEQYIIDDEIIGASCSLLKGIQVDTEHLAFEAIKDVGPGGHYLMSPHTLKHMRSEYFAGNGISHTGSRSSWEKDGCRDAWQRANERARAVVYADTVPRINQDIEVRIRAQFDVALDIGHATP